ncbi:MAG: RNA methyltransferase [Chlamydiales bacterium]|nr:RNA methyltransferase [Chlamydiales bacterium]
MTERVITSLTHPLVKHFVSLRESASYRDVTNSLFIQGRKLITELNATNKIKVLLVADPTLIPPGINAHEVLIGNEAILQKVSGVITPEGVVAEIEKPSWSNLEGAEKVLALDGVSDPGNVGTLLRTAAAFGWDGVYFLEGCCDPFNDKAIRSAMGATFRIPLAKGNWTDLQKMSLERQWTALVGDLDGVPLDHATWNQGLLLVLGSEAHGASPTARGFCTAVTIPMTQQMESLNVAVAGGILMYVLGKG